jgi:hypothetical protein
MFFQERWKTNPNNFRGGILPPPRDPYFSLIPPVRYSCGSRKPCLEAESILKVSGNLQPFDLDPGSMARGDELLKSTG